MVGSLARLRDECRRAKERLSDETATAIVVDLPGLETTVRMTRMELDDLIAGPLAEFLAALVDTLERNRVPLASISAVATVGGGARIPLITQRLSEHLRAKVVTTPHPQLTAAEGVALIAHRSQIVETATDPRPRRAGHRHRRCGGVRGGAGLAGRRRTGVVRGRGRSRRRPGDRAAFRRPLRRRRRPTADRSCSFNHDEWEDADTKSRRRVPVLLFGLSAAAAVVAAVVFGLTSFTRDDSTVPAGTSSSIAPSPAPAVAVSRSRGRGPAPAPAQVVTTVVARPQQRVAPRQQPAAIAARPAAAGACPGAAPEPTGTRHLQPAPENPAPPTDPGTGTPPDRPRHRRRRHRNRHRPSTRHRRPGTGGTGTGTTADTGTGTGGTGTGTGGTGTGTGPAPAPEEQRFRPSQVWRSSPC